MGGIRGIARRLSWGLADQAVSSLSNFVVGVFVARELGVAAFGVFSLAWVTYGMVLNVSRGLATDPLTVRFSGVAEGTWRTASARASGTAVLVGVVFGLLSMLAGLALGGAVGSAFVALGVVAPGLLLQDSLALRVLRPRRGAQGAAQRRRLGGGDGPAAAARRARRRRRRLRARVGRRGAGRRGCTAGCRAGSCPG